MNKLSFISLLNSLIIIILIFQATIIIYNSSNKYTDIHNKNISLENFSSIMLSNYGITTFGSEKLIKQDDYNIYLQGKSYLENNVYKIYGQNILINIKTEISSSDKSVEAINSMGKIYSKGFNNYAKEGKTYFIGESIFRFDD